MNKGIYDLFDSYVKKGVSIIPCKMVYDKDNQIYTGKMPAIRGWSEYCNELPSNDDIRAWAAIPNVNGFGIATGEASNICCIDIDTTNQELIKKIKAIIPYTPCIIKGDKKRGGKFLYRLYDTIHDFTPKQVQKEKVKDKNGNTVVDVLWGNSYLCAPPSIHSKTLDGEEIRYEWDSEGHELLDCLPALPILDDQDIVKKIDMVVRGMTVNEINHNLPVKKNGNLNIDLSQTTKKGMAAEGQRWEDMVSFCNGMIARKLDPTTIIKEMLIRDQARNGSNPYFSDATKGCTHPSPTFNAIKFYMGNLDFANRGKNINEMEMPALNEERIYTPRDQWGAIKDTSMIKDFGSFQYGWIENPELRNYIQRECEANCVSPQNIFFYMLAGLSSCIGNKIKIKPYKSYSGYDETCNLYVCNVAPSGERKSQISRVALKSLKKLNKEAIKRAEEQVSQNAQANKDLDVSIAKKEKDRKREIEENGHDSEFAKELLGEIDSLKEKKKIASLPSLIEKETTIQKLYQIVEENPNGILIEFNELGPMWKDIQSPNNADMKRFYLDGWDGQSYFSYKTKHHGENKVDELCLSIAASIQYDVIGELVDEIVKNKGMNDGLIQRFLFFCNDDNKKTFTDVNVKTPEKLYQIFENAYYIEKKDDPILFDNGAYKLWEKFSNSLNAKIELEQNSSLVSALSKYSGLVIRLAGNLEVLKNDGHRPSFITEKSFMTAWEMLEYAEKHLRYLFSIQERKTYSELISLFKTGGIEDELSIRDLYRHHQKYFGKSASEATKVIEKLVGLNVIKVIKDGRSMKIKINPSLFAI